MSQLETMNKAAKLISEALVILKAEKDKIEHEFSECADMEKALCLLHEAQIVLVAVD
jgi:hypothetical protein